MKIATIFNKHLLYSLFTILGVSTICFIFLPIIGYKAVGLIFFLALSILAISLEIIPVLIAAVLSALILNFYFIPPYYTFHIDGIEDVMMFIIYISVALMNAIFTNRIKKAEKKLQLEHEKERTIALYNTLFNSLSHELKTPIASIISSIDILKNNDLNTNVKDRTELYMQIEESSERLNKQVENLLSMSRIESGTMKLNKSWTDINDMILSVIRKLQVYTHQQHINYTINDDLPLCKIDEVIIEQVIYILLNNAINYTPIGSKVTILTMIDNRSLVIKVADNGNGVPERFLTQIFEKFFRMPTTTGGTGLGLSIAKGFIEAHNGLIYAENISPVGFLITIKIPCELSYVNHLKNE